MPAVLATAFIEGLCVLVVEIAGARALAPYFGASLRVWTAQITATLLFLALGYGLGGRLCGRGPRMLPAVLVAAGAWLALYPVWRTPVLGALGGLGVSAGALLSASFLFGPPLTCFGAVSPLLIERLGALGVRPGEAAGRLFFTNTIGGLAGGWLTALVLVPNVPLRAALAGTGIVVAALGGLWAGARRGTLAVWLLSLAGMATVVASPQPLSALRLPGQDGVALHVRARAQTSAGLVHVVEVPGVTRILLLNGTNQGSVALPSYASYEPFSDYLAVLGHRYHPGARRALLLGLGSGALARTLHGLGMQVTAVELVPEIAAFARSYFGMPEQVHVVVEDARAFLATDTGSYDLVFLDAFAGETSPWYLLTREGLAAARARLAPKGRLLVNTVTRADGQSAGLQRLEAALLSVFGEAQVFVEPRLPIEGDLLVNATLVAGAALRASELPYPGTPSERVAPFLGDLAATTLRPARAGAPIDTDELSALDLLDADLRMRWRNDVITRFGAAVLED